MATSVTPAPAEETSHRVIVDKKKGKIVTSFPQKAN
jgi:hypothetical protein